MPSELAEGVDLRDQQRDRPGKAAARRVFVQTFREVAIALDRALEIGVLVERELAALSLRVPVQRNREEDALLLPLDQVEVHQPVEGAALRPVCHPQRDVLGQTGREQGQGGEVLRGLPVALQKDIEGEVEARHQAIETSPLAVGQSGELVSAPEDLGRRHGVDVVAPQHLDQACRRQLLREMTREQRQRPRMAVNEGDDLAPGLAVGPARTEDAALAQLVLQQAGDLRVVHRRHLNAVLAWTAAGPAAGH